jgi:riboflavin biosynthesis pyrimidine reductase
MRAAALAPDPGNWVDLDGNALDAWLTDRYALEGDRWLRLNMVTALGGEISGPSGTSEELAGGIDRPLLRVLRASGDVVLVGAASIRAGGYPLPRLAPLAVATTTGDLSGHALPAGTTPERLLVLCPPSAAARATATLGGIGTVLPLHGDPVADPALLLDALAAHGRSRIVCEGGGGIASRLFAAGLVDEFDQSIAPIVSSPGAPLTAGTVPLVSGRLRGLLRDGTDRLYARWTFPTRLR